MKATNNDSFSWVPRLTLTVLSLILFVILFVVSAFLSSPAQATANPVINSIGASIAQVNYSRTDLDDPNAVSDSDSSKHLIDRSRQNLKQSTESLREQIGLEGSTSKEEDTEYAKSMENKPFQGVKNLQNRNLTEKK